MHSTRRRLGRSVLGALAMAVAAFAIAPAVQAAQPIKIGFSLELTGPLAGGGKPSLLAIQMWAQDTNDAGGLLGRPVQLVYYDDQSNPANVPAIYTKLLDVDKVDFVMSSYGTNLIAPAMPIVMAHNKVYFGLFGTAVNAKFHYNKYFSILPNGPDPALGPDYGFFQVAEEMKPKPETVALVAADAEYAQNVIGGARRVVKQLGLKTVYDQSYPPSITDCTPIMHAVQATNPDIVYVASYPPDTICMVRAANEIGLKTKIFGGGMIGLAFAPIKTQLGPLLNGIIAYDVYVPAPTMDFPGVQAFLKIYQAKAKVEHVDPLGYYLPPYAYAQMQILGDAIKATGSLDQDKIGAYIHKTTFHTIVGDIAFNDAGEWRKARILFVQYKGVQGHDLAQFTHVGTQTILYPPEFKDGTFEYPYSGIKK